MQVVRIVQFSSLIYAIFSMCLNVFPKLELELCISVLFKVVFIN